MGRRYRRGSRYVRPASIHKVIHSVIHCTIHRSSPDYVDPSLSSKGVCQAFRQPTPNSPPVALIVLFRPDTWSGQLTDNLLESKTAPRPTWDRPAGIGRIRPSSSLVLSRAPGPPVRSQLLLQAAVSQFLRTGLRRSLRSAVNWRFKFCTTLALGNCCRGTESCLLIGQAPWRRNTSASVLNRRGRSRRGSADQLPPQEAMSSPASAAGKNHSSFRLWSRTAGPITHCGGLSLQDRQRDETGPARSTTRCMAGPTKPPGGGLSAWRAPSK